MPTLIYSSSGQNYGWILRVKSEFSCKEYTLMNLGQDFLHAFGIFLKFYIIFQIEPQSEIKNLFNFLKTYVLRIEENDPNPDLNNKILMYFNNSDEQQMEVVNHPDQENINQLIV